MARVLPTQAVRRVLLALSAGRRTNGIHNGTLNAMKRRGLITDKIELTTVGKDVVIRLTTVPEVTHVA